ncbi:unnamed protein product, partial [Ectocarpus sp. 4 AP-2014]
MHYDNPVALTGSEARLVFARFVVGHVVSVIDVDVRLVHVDKLILFFLAVGQAEGLRKVDEVLTNARFPVFRNRVAGRARHPLVAHYLKPVVDRPLAHVDGISILVIIGDGFHTPAANPSAPAGVVDSFGVGLQPRPHVPRIHGGADLVLISDILLHLLLCFRQQATLV